MVKMVILCYVFSITIEKEKKEMGFKFPLYFRWIMDLGVIECLFYACNYAGGIKIWIKPNSLFQGDQIKTKPKF